MIFANHPLNSKRSMKFSSNLMTSALSDQETGAGSDGAGFGRGSGRSSGPGSAPHHHHIGHWARAGRAPQVVLFDNETPFGHAPKPSRTATANNSRHSSRAMSPRNAHYLRVSTTNGKKIGHVASYDIDVESIGDERTPLVGSIRVGGRRRTSASEGVMRGQQYTSTNRWLTRFAGCLALTTVILLVVIGAMGFFLATTKPLTDVRIHEIMNVLASEQEIMLDLSLDAVNPNMVAVTVEKMDINVFAKSRKMRHHHHRHDHDDDDDNDNDNDDDEMRQYHHPPSPSDLHRTSSHSALIRDAHQSRYHSTESVDRGTDPMPDPASDSNTMLLGRIFEFDSAPTFEGSPLAHRPSTSIGEVRLAKPGNKTEEGGTARWERVLQHPFELIVRGVLKYQLPLSGVVRSAPIGASVLVHPELGVDRAGRMYVEPLPRLSGLGEGSNTILEEVDDDEEETGLRSSALKVKEDG